MPPLTELRYQSLFSAFELEELDVAFLDRHKWREWEETGFNIPLQIRKLVSSYKRKVSEGLSSQQALSEWTQETAEDLEGFWNEFVRQYLILPIKIEKQFINGKWEIVAPRYSNEPLTKITTREERNGALKQGIEKLTEFLASAPRVSVAILISPSGWSGLKSEQGENIIYPETQIYLYRVNISGQIEAFAVRVSISLLQNQTLQSILSGNQAPSSNRFSTEQGIVENIVRNPILINGAESQVDFEEILRIIEQVRGSKYALDYWVRNSRGQTHVQRTFSELWQHFRNRYAILQFEEKADFASENAKAKWLIDSFRHFMESIEFINSDGLEEIAEELDKVLRNLYRVHECLIFDPQYDQITLTEIERQREMQKIQGLFGCAGISSGFGIMVTPLGTRSFTVESGTKFYHCGACGKTGQFTEDELSNGRPKCGKAVVSR